MPEFKNPSVVELLVLRGFAGCLWSNMINAGHIKIAALLVLNVPYVSDSATEDTTLRIVLQYVWIGTFISGLGFISFGDDQ